jgi:protein-S-isoprenylcysteine O-methyltransferase Ste14
VSSVPSGHALAVHPRVVRWVRTLAAARMTLYGVAGAGGAWWIAVAASDDVQRWTLGGLPAGWVAGPDLCFFVAASAIAARHASWRLACVAAVWAASVTAALVAYAFSTGRAGWGCVGMVPATVLLVAATVTLRRGEFPTHWFFAGPFRFVVARPAPAARHLAASLGQLVVFWTAFFVVIPLLLSAAEQRMGIDAPALDRPGVRLAGSAMLAVGSALGVWSCVTMATVGQGTPLPAATARRLVIRGPYRNVRNPMALAGATQTIGVGLIFGSWTVVAVALLGAVVWDAFIRPEEEADLGRRFGAPYNYYEATVRCWLPSIHQA